MKAWRQGCVAAVLALALAGCGGGDDPAPASSGDEGETSEDAPQAEPTEPEAPQVAPFDEPVAIDFSIDLRRDRQLMVKGESNLPDGARLQVTVERPRSGRRWSDRTEMEQGRFTAGPFGPGSGLTDGDYRVTVALEAATVQPRGVRERIGQEGEHLRGPLVESTPHGLGQVARRTQRFLLGDEPRQVSDRVEVREVEENPASE